MFTRISLPPFFYLTGLNRPINQFKIDKACYGIRFIVTLIVVPIIGHYERVNYFTQYLI